MNVATYRTRNISMATALLCPTYVIVHAHDDAEERSDAALVSLVDSTMVEPAEGRKPLCEFVLGCADQRALEFKVASYLDRVLYVAPEVYDEQKKRVVAVMRQTRKD